MILCPPMSKEPSYPSIKRLYALSGNLCAFPGCPTPVIDPESGVVISQVCHIKAREEGGPRFDRTQTEDERNAFENLILLCNVHHKIIDTDIAAYPVERLQKMKAEHEAKYKHGAMPNDELARKLLLTLSVAGSVITTHNQSGGQVAHQITNYYQQPEKLMVTLTPVVEYPLTKVERELDLLGFYDFRLSLRNDGRKSVKEFMVEVEIPRKYMQGGGYTSEVHARTPDKRRFRHTQRELSPTSPFTLYPSDTQPVISLNFQVSRGQFLAGITEIIAVRVFSDDEQVGREDFLIANILNPEHVEVMLSGAA